MDDSVKTAESSGSFYVVSNTFFLESGFLAEVWPDLTFKAIDAFEVGVFPDAPGVFHLLLAPVEPGNTGAYFRVGHLRLSRRPSLPIRVGFTMLAILNHLFAQQLVLQDDIAHFLKGRNPMVGFF